MMFVPRSCTAIIQATGGLHSEMLLAACISSVECIAVKITLLVVLLQCLERRAVKQGAALLAEPLPALA